VQFEELPDGLQSLVRVPLPQATLHLLQAAQESGLKKDYADIVLSSGVQHNMPKLPQMWRQRHNCCHINFFLP